LLVLPLKIYAISVPSKDLGMSLTIHPHIDH
jgi:hypothetical protein